MTGISEIVKTEFARTIGKNPSELTIGLRKPLDAQSNHLYDVWAPDEHFIAKEYLKPDELTAAPQREYQALCRLSGLDIAPQPIFYEPSLAPIVIYRYMEGEMWDRRPAGARDLAALLNLWLTLHAIPINWFSRGYGRSLQEIEDEFRRSFLSYLDWTQLAFPPGKRAAETCLEWLARRHSVFQELAELPVVPCFCRSDPRFANVIQRPNGRLGLVDWEDSGLRDPARELADLILHPNQEDLLNWQEWQAFMGPYLAARSPLDPTIHRRTQLYLAIFPFFWLTQLLRRGIQWSSSGQGAGWMINGLPGNIRLKRYLAWELAWPKPMNGTVMEPLAVFSFFPGP
jgi:aminoglycoside phosphotransferase (APT) family kinase protein